MGHMPAGQKSFSMESLMSSLEYLRPATLQEAVALLNRPGRRTVPLAGGGWLAPRLRHDVDVPNPLPEPVDAVVDLADLNLAGVELEGEPGHGWLRLGATTTLSALADDTACRQALAGEALAEAARYAAALNQRNAATVAGALLGADSANELLLLLLALGTEAEVMDAAGTRTLPIQQLADLSAGSLVTRISIPWPTQAARGALARVARTPTDEPIIAAAGVCEGDRCMVAVGGLCAVPLVFDGSGDLMAALAAAAADHPVRSDWLGSAEYRREMAQILATRVAGK